MNTNMELYLSGLTINEIKRAQKLDKNELEEFRLSICEKDTSAHRAAAKSRALSMYFKGTNLFIVWRKTGISLRTLREYISRAKKDIAHGMFLSGYSAKNIKKTTNISKQEAKEFMSALSEQDLKIHTEQIVKRAKELEDKNFTSLEISVILNISEYMARNLLSDNNDFSLTVDDHMCYFK